MSSSPQETNGGPGKPLATHDPLPSGLERSIKIGAACGAVGFLLGGTAGILKFGGSSSTGFAPLLFAGASGIQTFAIGASFWTIRTATLAAWTQPRSQPTSRDLVKASAVSGGVTGGALAMAMRGRSNIIPGVIMFSIFGAAGQWMYNGMSAPRKADSEPKKNFWERVGERSWSPMKVLSNEEYAAMLRERQLKIDVEIAVIDDKIAELKEEIARQPKNPEPSGPNKD